MNQQTQDSQPSQANQANPPGIHSPAAGGVPRLEIKNLGVSFATDEGRTVAVAELSLSIAAGETLALVGESGSGKSVTSLSLMGLHARSSQAQVTGEAWFVKRDGSRVNLLAMPPQSLRKICGDEIGMIFQEPMSSLNPVMTVGTQIGESLRLHKGLDARTARAHSLRMLELVEIPAARQRIDDYPHQLSGGLRQRVMIAMAMACDPSLLIADEPTTALDATVQAQILALMARLQKETGMSLLFVTHNLGVVAQFADRVAVIYSGRIVEETSVLSLFATPRHPYSRGLLACLPSLARLQTPETRAFVRPRLATISGVTARAGDSMPGCRFAPRCPERVAKCELGEPKLEPFSPSETHLQSHKLPATMVRCVVAHEGGRA